MELKDYEQRVGKSRHIEVKINCEYCGAEKWAKWSRVKIGQGRFCSLKCSQSWYKDDGKKNWGKENAFFFWEEERNTWYAGWIDKETGKQKRSTKARWLWEDAHGELPRNVVVTYIDGNPKNCELINLKSLSRSESNSIHLQGHVMSKKTKQKISTAHAGKTLTEEHKLKIGDSVQRRWASGEFDSIHVGENNIHWRGGVVRVYPKDFSKDLKKRIMARDDFKCRVCYRNIKRMEVHHIDGNKENNDWENLITLCTKCHHRVHEKSSYHDPIILAFRSMLK